MRARRAPARGLGALLLLCLLLAGALALEMRYPQALVLSVALPGDAPVAGPEPGLGGTVEDGIYRPPGDADFAVIERRPLFSPMRRPPEAGNATAEEGPAPPAALDGLVLTGIIRAGDAWVAIVEPVGPPRPGNEALSLRVGETLRGWSVEQIGTDRLVLAHGAQRFEMALTDDPTRRRTRPRAPTAPAGTLRAPGQFAPQPQQPLQPAPQPQPQSEQ